MIKRSAVVVLGLVLALVTGGVVVFVTADPITFGWFAYAPLSTSTVGVPWALAWTDRQVIGVGIVLIGLLLGAAGVGHLLGRRAPRARGLPVEPMTLDEARAVRGSGWDGPDLG